MAHYKSYLKCVFSLVLCSPPLVCSTGHTTRTPAPVPPTLAAQLTQLQLLLNRSQKAPSTAALNDLGDAAMTYDKDPWSKIFPQVRTSETYLAGFPGCLNVFRTVPASLLFFNWFRQKLFFVRFRQIGPCPDQFGGLEHFPLLGVFSAGLFSNI